MKRLLSTLCVMLSLGTAYADTKISAMTSTTTLNSVDVVPVVTNPSTSAANRIITKTDLKSTLGISTLETNFPVSLSTAVTNSLPSGYRITSGSGTIPSTFTITNASVTFLDNGTGSVVIGAPSPYIAVSAGTAFTIAGSSVIVDIENAGNTQTGFFIRHSTATSYKETGMQLLSQADGFISGSGSGDTVISNSGGKIFFQNSWPTGGATAFLDTNGLTLPGLSSGKCVETTTGGRLTASTSACNVVGGGSSALAVTTGTAAGFTTITSSPTAVINFNSSQFGVALTGSATAYTTLNTSSVTLMGNTFNGANQLLQADSGGLLAAADLPSDGYASTYVNVTGDTMTGQLTVTGSSITVTGANGINATYAVNAGSINVNGSGGGVLDITEGATQTGVASHAVIFASSADRWLNFNPNNTATFLIAATSQTVTNGQFAVFGSTGGAVYASASVSSAAVTTSLTIPTGTNPTVDASGKLGWDTTDGVLVGNDGTGANVIGFSTHSVTVTISSGTGFNGLTIPVWRAPTDMAVSITKILAETLPAGTTVNYQLNERAYGSVNTSGSNLFSVSYSTANDAGVSTSALSDSSIASQASLVFTTPASGASAGSPSLVTLTIYFKRNQE